MTSKIYFQSIMMLHSSHCADVPRVAPGLLPEPRLPPHLRPLPRLLQDGAQLGVLTLGVLGLVPDTHHHQAFTNNTE